MIHTPWVTEGFCRWVGRTARALLQDTKLHTDCIWAGPFSLCRAASDSNSDSQDNSVDRIKVLRLPLMHISFKRSVWKARKQVLRGSPEVSKGEEDLPVTYMEGKPWRNHALISQLLSLLLVSVACVLSCTHAREKRKQHSPHLLGHKLLPTANKDMSSHHGFHGGACTENLFRQ